MAEEISWDEATSNDGFVALTSDVEKIIEVNNHRLERKPSDAKIAPGAVEFMADVIFEDGEAAPKDKIFATTSKRLKEKLRPIFEKKMPADKTKLSILRVGEAFNTQYSVKEIKE